MRNYRTEILIPPDRTVVLQLPSQMPEGRAYVVIQAEGPECTEASGIDTDPDRQDIEWWDEFEDDVVEEEEVDVPSSPRES